MIDEGLSLSDVTTTKEETHRWPDRADAKPTGGQAGPLSVARASLIVGDELVFPQYFFFCARAGTPDPDLQVGGRRFVPPSRYPTSVFFKAPFVPSRARRPGPCLPSYNVLVNAAYLGSLAEEVFDFDVRTLEFSRQLVPIPAGLCVDLFRFHRDCQRNTEESRRTVECLIPLIAVGFLRSVVPEGERASLLRCRHPGVIRALRFARRSFKEALTVDDMARSAGLSISQFSVVFRRDVGCTPHEYVNRLRVEEARRLLSAGYFVTEVAFAVGFESLSGFEESFVRTVGVPPRTYRDARRG